jgi:hypothetical protein
LPLSRLLPGNRRKLPLLNRIRCGVEFGRYRDMADMAVLVAGSIRLRLMPLRTLI